MMIRTSESSPIAAGQLWLGTWQGLFCTNTVRRVPSGRSPSRCSEKQTAKVDDGPVPLLHSERDELSEFVQEAPPMHGGEFLASDLLERLWQEFGA
jgi:hypothetical protein